mmetsp:Transcript_89397/g.257874  ORF Transcript_89397/g.257874 Transcript_89397/m.257874 type:complete len:236 (+) Transcript_89397:2937-3644(+)
MLTQKTSFECCGRLESHVGEFGCPTKRPSSEVAARMSASLKPSSGTAASGPEISSSAHQCSTITNLTRRSYSRGPSSSVESAFRKTTTSMASGFAANESASASCSSFSRASAAAAAASRSCCKTSSTSLHLFKTAFATSRRESTLRLRKRFTQSVTRAGSMRVSASCRRSRKFDCHKSVIMRFSKSCTASPTSSVNSWSCSWPKRCTAVKRLSSSLLGMASSNASQSKDAKATCM